MPKSSQKIIKEEGESQFRFTYKCIVIGDKMFKNQRQYELFVRLHRKKCEECVLSNPNGNNTKHESLMYTFTPDLEQVKKSGSNMNSHGPEYAFDEMRRKMGI